MGVWATATATVLGFSTIRSAVGAKDGLALRPPMGWRTWNCFHLDVDQAMMEDVMDHMVERKRLVDGVPKSLADLGYTRIGLDDGWQESGNGVNGSFHDAEGRPIVNKTRFPSMKGMTAYGHARGLFVEWYMNNCWEVENMLRPESPEYEAKHMQGDVQALLEADFDGVKLDGCGPYTNLSWWYQLLNATGRPFEVENCHWGSDPPPCDNDDCPFHYWRVSGDIQDTWEVVLDNLQHVEPFLRDPPLAGPGQWAYPDMMETGRLATHAEDRANFGLWVITSSPLILSFDPRDEDVTERLWPIIANPEAIAVNQAWEGHPGRLVKEVRLPLQKHLVSALPCDVQGEWQRPASWELRYKSDGTGFVQVVDTVTGKCADAANQGQVELNTCNWTASQTFRYEKDTGRLRAPFYPNNQGKLNGCLDIFAKLGPRIQLTGCTLDPNLNFRFVNGTWYGSGVDSRRAFPLRCMRDVQDSEISWQVWSKPVSGKALAVLFVNSKAPAAEFELNLVSDLKLDPQKAYKVRDVWSREDRAEIPAGGKLKSDKLDMHDTCFYLLTPLSDSGSLEAVTV